MTPSTVFIETPRLRIRAWTATDRPAFANMAKDTAMMKYITDGQAMTETQIDASLARQERFMAEVGYCMGAAELKTSGEIVGVIGLQPVDRDPDIDIGWWIRADQQRLGLASEAASALASFVHSNFPGARITASVHPENLASQAVARKIGLVPSGPVSANQIASWRPDVPVLVFREPDTVLR